MRIIFQEIIRSINLYYQYHKICQHKYPSNEGITLVNVLTHDELLKCLLLILLFLFNSKSSF